MYFKKVKLFNHDCLAILMLFYIILYIMIAYLMLFAAFSNATCLYNASFLLTFSLALMTLIFANAFCFHALLWFIVT